MLGDNSWQFFSSLFPWTPILPFPSVMTDELCQFSSFLAVYIGKLGHKPTALALMLLCFPSCHRRYLGLEDFSGKIAERGI